MHRKLLVASLSASFFWSTTEILAKNMEEIRCKLQGRPATPAELGNAGWTILHSTAAAFPENPTEDWKIGALELLAGWSKVYPCRHCAFHMREYMRDHPPDVTSRKAFSLWLMEFHNEVNRIRGADVVDGDPVVIYGYPGVDTEDDLDDLVSGPLTAATLRPPATKMTPTTFAALFPSWGSSNPVAHSTHSSFPEAPRQSSAESPRSDSSSPFRGLTTDAARQAKLEALLASCAHWCPKKKSPAAATMAAAPAE